MSTYEVRLIDGTVKTFEAEDVQITANAVKLLNGTGKGAQIVAYFPGHRVDAVEKKA